MDLLLKRGKLKDIILILLGTLSIALSINLIFEPMDLVTGGVTGLALIIRHLSSPFFEGGLPVWFLNLMFNVPLFIAAFFILGFRTIAKTLFATISLTAFLYLIPISTDMFAGDFLLAAIFGGMMAGLGIGLVILTMTTTGGTDLLAMMIQKKKPYYSIPQVILVIDGLVVVFGAVVFGIHKSLYAVIAVYICAKISDGILEGMKFAKSAFIISDNHEVISIEILHNLNRGVTGLHATGMYSNAGKNVLLCVVSKKEMVAVLDIVHKNDPNAFVIVSDVREVKGEGFIEYIQQNGE